MKNIIITSMLLLGIMQGILAQNNAIDKYFQKYAQDDAFTSVYVSEYMFSLFANVDAEDPEDQEVMSILKGLKGLQVLTTEKNGLKLYEEATKLIDKTEYKVLMKVKDEGSKIQLLIKEEGKQVKELLLLVGEEHDFVLLSIVGDIALDKISKLAKHMDIKGLEHLNKVDQNK
jgi:hypothetical protein